MNKFLFFCICVFFLAHAVGGVSQELTLKKKGSTVVIQKQEESCDSSDNTSISSISELVGKGSDQTVIPPLTLKKKEVRKTSLPSVSSDQTETSNYSETTTDKYRFPISQFELYVAYVSYSEYEMRGSGVNIQGTVRQKQDPKKKSAWGLGALFGRYETKVPETDTSTFTAKTKEFGGFVSLAKTTNRPTWNSIVWNSGVKQVVDEGNINDFRRKQIDIILFTSLYLDLTRSRDAFFSRTNLSFYYQYPLKTEVESYNSGQRVEDFIWNNKMFSMNIDQTVLQFNLAEAVDRASLNVGLNAGYKHYSQYKKDIYVGGIFGEIFYKLLKVCRVGIEFHIDPSSNPTRNNTLFKGKKTEIKAEFDLYQIGRMIF